MLKIVVVESDNLNPKYIKAEVEVKTEAIVSGQTTDQIVGMIEIDPDSNEVMEGAVSKIIPEDTVDRIAEEIMGIIVIEMMVTVEVGTGLEKDHSGCYRNSCIYSYRNDGRNRSREGSFSGDYGSNRTRSMSSSRLNQDPELVLIGIG